MTWVRQLLSHQEEPQPWSGNFGLFSKKFCKTGVKYNYTFNSIDPDDDDISYYINWGDGQIHKWIGTYESGENVVFNHSWNSIGLYKIKVIAYCEDGLPREAISDRFAIQTHTLTNPTILYPNGGEILSGQVTVEWNHTFCSWDHNITYQTFYSVDGINWIEFSSVPYWDTSTLPESTNYSIMVVATCSEGKNSSDVSDGVFSIGIPAIPSMYPNLIVISSFLGLSYIVFKFSNKTKKELQK